jgi:hypothetical protein
VPIHLRLALALVASLAACGEAGVPHPPETPPAWRPAFDASATGWLLDVWGTSPTDLYAAGGRPDRGLVMHSDGTSWTAVPLGLDVPLLNWIHGFGPGDITIVGNSGTVIHWDGSRWGRQETPTRQDLWGVWGASPDDLWAVGGSGLSAGDATLLHFDGRGWSAVRPPPLQRANVFAFYKVWGTASDNAYVVGQRGAVLHWNGGSWSEELAGASDDLISLWGTGPDHIVAVGGRGNGVASVWDGVAWTTRSLAPEPGLNGIWFDDDRVAHLAGNGGALVRLDLETFATQDEPSGTTLDVHSIFGLGGVLTAVGGSLTSERGPYLGVALTRPKGGDE